MSTSRPTITVGVIKYDEWPNRVLDKGYTTDEVTEKLEFLPDSYFNKVYHGRSEPYSCFYYNQTPISFAIRTKNDAIFSAVLARTADVNVPDDDGNTPLHIVAETGNIHYMIGLIEKGANIEAVGCQGKETPYDVALRLNHPRFCTILSTQYGATTQSSPYSTRAMAKLMKSLARRGLGFRV